MEQAPVLHHTERKEAIPIKTILIVCGAGASSTFLASRMRAIARTRNAPFAIEAASDIDLAPRLACVHLLLVGHTSPPPSMRSARRRKISV